MIEIMRGVMAERMDMEKGVIPETEEGRELMEISGQIQETVHTDQGLKKTVKALGGACVVIDTGGRAAGKVDVDKEIIGEHRQGVHVVTAESVGGHHIHDTAHLDVVREINRKRETQGLALGVGVHIWALNADSILAIRALLVLNAI